MLISVVVAMKDEEGSLPHLARELESLSASLAARGDSLETVLVDDASTDATVTVAQAWCDAGRGRKLLRHAANRGFGASLRTGVAATTGDVVVSYDADCAYPSGDVLKMLDALAAGADVASATPFAEGGSFGAGPFRRLLSSTCSGLYRLALRGRAKGVRTFTCAFRAYRGDLVRGLVWKSDRFLAAAEILGRALLAGARVVEIPSTLRERVAGVSKMKVVRTAFGHLGLIARLAVTPGAA